MNGHVFFLTEKLEGSDTLLVNVNEHHTGRNIATESYLVIKDVPTAA